MSCFLSFPFFADRSFSFRIYCHKEKSKGVILMKSYRIRGKNRLVGTVTVSGSKNASLPILFASLLFREGATLHSLASIRDVAAALHILQTCGATVTPLGGDTYTVKTDTLIYPDDLCDAACLRAGIYLLPVLLSRFGRARLPLPGGCDFGNRPIDYHVAALRKMGAHVRVSDREIVAVAPLLHGAGITLPRPSVGATVTCLLAAVTAIGETHVIGAATEPHITDLIRFLKKGGARIKGEGTPRLSVMGVPSLTYADHCIIGDAIEGGTYLLAGAITGGSVSVRGMDVAEAECLNAPLREMGVSLYFDGDTVTADARERLRPASIITAPYPGFPTDLQPLLGACLTVADGSGSIKDEVWQSRFRYTEELKKLGANVTVTENTAVFRGIDRLRGASMQACDLRGGAASVLAALAAEGESLVTNVELIERGYADLPKKLRSLGADIEEISL